MTVERDVYVTGISNWRIDQGLDDRYFTVRYLERGM